MTTRSGSNVRAISTASAAVPASVTTSKLLPALEEGHEALADDLVVIDDDQPDGEGAD